MIWSTLKPKPTDRILVYGIGNPCREDDAIGPSLCDRLEKVFFDQIGTRIKFESAYQLNVEDALLFSQFDLILLLDALKTFSCEGSTEPYCLQRVLSQRQICFSTHSVEPSSVLALCEELYQASPRVYLLAIAGENWGIGESLSQSAQLRLDLALKDLLEFNTYA